MRRGDPQSRAEVLERFLKDTAEHKMTVLRDDGNYRHLRCQKPGTWCYGFDIVTWPGFLAISGDMGEAMFARTADMIGFFRTADQHHDEAGGLYINPSYWSEKCKAGGDEQFEFVPKFFEAYVKEQFDEHIENHSEVVFEGDSDKPVPPEWASQLWAELRDDVIGAIEDDDSLHEAMIALRDYGQPHSNPKRFGGFDFGSDIGEVASRLQQRTFHWIWRLYAISWAVRAYDALKADAAGASASA